MDFRLNPLAFAAVFLSYGQVLSLVRGMVRIAHNASIGPANLILYIRISYQSYTIYFLTLDRNLRLVIDLV